MIVRSVSPGSRGVDLVGMIDAHVGLHDQRDANKAQAASASPRHDPGAALSQALAHPTRRPAFLMTGVRTDAGYGSRRGGSRRHLARTDKGDEAELPDWHRMQAGDRLEGPIPGHGPQGVPLRSDAPRRLRVMQPVAPRAVPTRAVPRSSMSAGGMDATARRVMAVAGRARACAWLFSPPAGASQAAV